jgi:capsular polysaccharide biosynthesis protein
LLLVMIPLGLALGLAGGAVLNYVLPKKYEAQTTIEVKPEADVQITPQFFATEFERLKSRKALAAVAKRLELEKLWMLGEAEVIRILKGIISVQNIRGTDLLSIHVRHTNAQDATAIANTLSLVYQESSPNKLLVHETAVVPKHPVSPNLKLNLVLAAFTGLISSPLVALLGMVILQRLIPERRSKQASFVERSGSPPDLLPMRSEHKIGLTLALHALLFAVLFGLFFFVVPPWATLMSKFEPPLPTIPSILYRISNMPRIWVMIALLVLIVIDVSGCFISNKSGGRRALRFWSIGVITVLVLTVFLMGLAISKPLLHLTSDLNQENQLRPTGRELNQNAKASNQRMSWILEKNPPLAAAAPGLDLAPTFPLQSDAVGWAEFDGQFNPVMYLALPFPRGGSEGPVDGPRRTPGAPIQLNIYRGTNALATANRFLGSYEFTCQPPDAVLRAEFSLSSEGILHLNVYPDGDGVMIAGRQVRQPDPPDKPSGGIRKMVVTPEQSAEAEQDNRNEKITVEDLALQMIVAIREKNDAKLKSLASDQVKGWPDALPVFAVELREHFRQFTGNENFDLKTGESLVEGDLAAVRCTGPVELEGKCLVLFFVKTKEGWRNYSLRNSTVGNSLEKHLADLKVAIRKQE